MCAVDFIIGDSGSTSDESTSAEFLRLFYFLWSVNIFAALFIAVVLEDIRFM